MRHALCLCTLLALPAHADEVWDTPTGPVVYESEIGDAAVLVLTQPDGTRVEMVFPGLAGNYDNRRLHGGYWVTPGDGPCPAALTSHSGLTSSDWGRVQIVFDRPAFPTAFTATFSECFGAFVAPLRAEIR